MAEGTINFYADSKLIQSFELNAEEMPKPFSINFTGALQLKIEFPNAWGRYAIADVVLK